MFANAVIQFIGESSNTPLTFKPECRTACTTGHLFHISGMSYGVIVMLRMRQCSIAVMQ
mgnify:CR=1 FL=1